MSSYTRWPNLICMVEAFGNNLELGSLLMGLCIGLLAGLILDFLWWRLGVNKYEKRLEGFEHSLGYAVVDCTENATGVS